MADTRTHDRLCVVIGTSILITSFLSRTPELVWVSLGSYSGLMISPDWDWDNWLTVQGGRRIRIYGQVLRRWRWAKRYYQWLTVYARILPHRHRLSHTLGLSTLLRALWSIWPIVALIIVPVPTLLWLVGLVIADAGHLLIDRRLTF